MSSTIKNNSAKPMVVSIHRYISVYVCVSLFHCLRRLYGMVIIIPILQIRKFKTIKG